VRKLAINEFFIICSIALLLTCTGSSCRDENNKNAVHYEVSRLGWFEGFVALINETRKQNTITEDYVVEILLMNVARDAGFVYSGKDLEMTSQLELTRKLYADNLIKDQLVKDPYDLNTFFENYPNQSPMTWAYAPKVIKDRDSYSKFCVWFKKLIEE